MNQRHVLHEGVKTNRCRKLHFASFYLPCPSHRINSLVHEGWTTTLDEMANQQRCLAKPRGEPCTNPRQTQHPCMAELRNCICFGCCEWLLVRWVSAWLAAAGVPLVSVNSAKDRFSLPADYQHPTSPVLCAFCTQPANGDEPLLECRGLRDGTACELAWHESCHQAVSGTAGPPPDSKFQCCTGWMARAEIDPKDRFCQPTTRYRKGLAKRGSLGPKGSAHGATAKVSAATTADASTAAAAANAPVPDVAAQPPATPASSSSAPPAEVTPPAGLPSTSLLTPHTSTGATRGPAVNSPAADAANADAAVDNGGADANGDAGSGWEDDPTRTGLPRRNMRRTRRRVRSQMCGGSTGRAPRSMHPAFRPLPARSASCS